MFLSQYYAQKLWPNHERQSAQARAFEESREYILPVRLDDTEVPGFLQTVGYLDLRSMSVEEIYQALVAKLSESTSPTTKTSISPTAAIQNNSGEFVMLFSPKGQKQYFIPFQSTTWDSTKIYLELIPELLEQVAFLGSLRNNLSNGFGRNTFAFALQEDAAWVSSQKVVQTMSRSQTVWKIILDEDGTKQNSSFYNEILFDNISSGQIAELRSRRILLDQKWSGHNRINHLSLEAIIQGEIFPSSETNLQAPQSPIPNLYRSFGQTPERFLKFARLASVLYLKLSNAVEHILELDLKLLNSKELQVNFKGKRAQSHTNVEPSIIQVNGICPLFI